MKVSVCYAQWDLVIKFMMFGSMKVFFSRKTKQITTIIFVVRVMIYVAVEVELQPVIVCLKPIKQLLNNLAQLCKVQFSYLFRN